MYPEAVMEGADKEEVALLREWSEGGDTVSEKMALDAWENFVANDGTIAFAVPFESGGIVLRVKFPSLYPSTVPLIGHVDVARAGLLTCESLDVLESLVDAAALRLAGNEATVDILSEFSDMLADVVQGSKQRGSPDELNADGNGNVVTDITFSASAVSLAPVLGRRAIYSHHIIAEGKRRAVMEWAVQCNLGGFCKIGWPGVIVVEGPESGCVQYVAALTRLRWKQIVVRGEETIPGTADDSIDDMRLIPRGMREFGPNDMSEMAAACKSCGCEALFLSAIKIKPSAEKGDHSGSDIISGVPITPPGKSTFQAHVARVKTPADARNVISKYPAAAGHHAQRTTYGRIAS